ncbi:hypothetical protein ACN9MJ_12900 [Acidovorax facilis]
MVTIAQTMLDVTNSTLSNTLPKQDILKAVDDAVAALTALQMSN